MSKPVLNKDVECKICKTSDTMQLFAGNYKKGASITWCKNGHITIDADTDSIDYLTFKLIDRTKKEYYTLGVI